MATTKETQPTKLTAAQLKKKVETQEEKIKSLKEGAWCYMCDTHKAKDKFYVSTDPMSKSGLTPICKDCAKKIALRTTNGVDQEPTRESVQLALRYLGKPFLEKVWDSSIQEVENLASGKVKLNYRQIEKANQTVMIGDMISVRGYGRFRLAQRDGFSKSGKAKIVIESLLRRRKK